MAENSSSTAVETPENVVETLKIPKIKHDFYQTDGQVVISVLAKNTKPEEVKVIFGDDTLSLSAQLPDGTSYELKLNLMHPIVPSQSTYRVSASKIELKLKKVSGVVWTALERDVSAPIVLQPMSEVAMSSAGPPKYPSSAPKAKDWDRLVGDIAKEEGDEKPEGEAALNALFQKIYSQGSDEVKRAMNKSFQESGGTVLSTNWNEVARDRVEVKAPDGMEWRKWEQ